MWTSRKADQNGTTKKGDIRDTTGSPTSNSVQAVANGGPCELPREPRQHIASIYAIPRPRVYIINSCPIGDVARLVAQVNSYGLNYWSGNSVCADERPDGHTSKLNANPDEARI